MTCVAGLSLILVCADSIADDEEVVDLMTGLNTAAHSVAGQWERAGRELKVNAVNGARLSLPWTPTVEYDFEIEFTRHTGRHSIALFFMAGGRQAAYDVDGWGQHLAGIQDIDGRSMRENPTRVPNIALQNGRRYTASVRVRRDRVEALLDGKVLTTYRGNGSDLSLPNLWSMPQNSTLGLGAWNSETTFHQVTVRPVDGSPAMRLASRSPAARSGNSAAGRTSPRPPRPANPSTRRPGTGKRVLIVIANRDFFYREYHDPRSALERAGITVEVAAGRKEACRPHNNSGQQGSGEVMPDLAVADADASRYDAIMFSGGWGSSMYQYAFRGSYGNRTYNGDQRTKAAVNRLLNDFIRQDKYVGALCHGVSVLAWARVNGRSILEGRRAVASPRQSPEGTYNGRRGQPLSRWNAEVNGARLSPARSIGNPRTSADDVLVDGRIITGEDDNSSRLFGETLARLLTNPRE